ncbi:MAG: hypothetical protein LBF90_03500 [Prevotellaceae bacterium]|jgi:DNA-binding CsgD family transcriptional regulator|nr:hypothetical protein [Prevotellaceae bacterium]
MKNVILITAFLVLPFTGQAASPDWQRKIINFERNQYKAGFQTWMITQIDNGWIYAANSQGLLEFDGVSWSLYPIRNEIVRSLKIIDGRIFVGGSSEYGFFEPDQTGRLTYHSLSAGVKKWGGEIWNILTSDARTYFVSERHILIYNDTTLVKIIVAKQKIDYSCTIDARLYIGTPAGLFFLHDDQLVFLPSSAGLRNSKFVGLLPYADKLLAVTAGDGLYLLDDRTLVPYRSTADDFIRHNRLFSVTMAGSKIVLGSVQHGAFVFDWQQPDYREWFGLHNGLNNNTILCTCFDKDQNLWLGLDKGVSYIDLNSPTRPLFATLSPIGTGYCSAVYRNRLYFGTNQGLYTAAPDGAYPLVPGSEGQIWSMEQIDHSLFCSGDNGIVVIPPNGDTYKINLSGVWEVHPLAAHPSKLIAATYAGLCILEKKNGRWALAYMIPDFFYSSKGLLEDDECGSFWIVNAADQIQKIRFNPEMTAIVDAKVYPGTSCGANRHFRRIDNNILICAKDGIYQYSRLSDCFIRHTQLEAMLDGQKYYEYLTIDPMKNIWFVSGAQLKVLPFKNGQYLPAYNTGLSDELINHYENVCLLDTTVAIVSADNAFMKVDFSKTSPLPPVPTCIREFSSTKNDSVISYNNAPRTAVLPYSQNSVIIRFAAAAFPLRSDVLYSCRLKGIDEDWGSPSPNTFKEYTNLHEGRYTFEVRAIVDGYTQEEHVAALEFEIRPPWRRSTAAFVVYVLLSLLAGSIVYRKTIGKQKKIIRLKRQELISQTRRHREETKVKDQEISALQTQNLQTELKFKTQELSGYILNVIRKNEMLEEVRKSAFGISRSIDERKDLQVIKQKVNRLISQINTNIANDNDFKVFESNFNLIHQDFLTLLEENFPQLSRSEKILCAYLKMNLSSKEIAPLLNITVRSVEVNRYRLRKKMNLSRDVNLSEYLQLLK